MTSSNSDGANMTDIPEAVLTRVTKALMQERDSIPGTDEEICRMIGVIVLTAAHYVEMAEALASTTDRLKTVVCASHFNEELSCAGQEIAEEHRCMYGRLYDKARAALKKAGVTP